MYVISVKLLVLVLCCFLILLNCPPLLSCSLLYFLKTTWILYWENCTPPFFWGESLIRKTFCCFVVSCFLDFSCCLKVLHSCLHIWRNSYLLLQSLLTDFRKEIPYVILSSNLRLSKTFSMDMPVPHFLSLGVGGFLSFYAFSQSCKARLGLTDCSLLLGWC